MREEAHEVMYEFPDLREMFIVVEKDALFPRSCFQIPPTIKHDHGSHRSRIFHGMTLASWRLLFYAPGLNGLVSSLKN